MTSTRAYHSPLREDQMELTRQRLLETVAELLADGVGDITVAAVAERAKVSVRTAYRYFPTKESLFDGFNAWLSATMGSPQLPTSMADAADAGARLFESFDRNEKLIRAARRSPVAAEVRARRKATQLRAMSRAIQTYAPHLDENEVKKVTAVCHLLYGSEAWLAMRDHLGFTTPQCVEALRWAVDAIIAKLDSERPRKGRK